MKLLFDVVNNVD